MASATFCVHSEPTPFLDHTSGIKTPEYLARFQGLGFKPSSQADTSRLPRSVLLRMILSLGRVPWRGQALAAGRACGQCGQVGLSPRPLVTQGRGGESRRGWGWA